MSEIVVLKKEDFTNAIKDAAIAAAEKVVSQMKFTSYPMTIEQLMEYLQCSRVSINRWIKTKDLPVRYLGADPRFYKDEIDEWLKNNR